LQENTIVEKKTGNSFAFHGLGGAKNKTKKEQRTDPPSIRDG